MTKPRPSETYLILVIVALAWASLSSVWAGDKAKQPDASQSLSFEDELVEGMNKKPWDSLSQISEKNSKNNGAHIYWKRSHFQPEAQGTLRELRYVQQ
jgi:hypothetical protein